MIFSERFSRSLNVVCMVVLCCFAMVCLTGCNEDKKYRKHLEQGDSYYSQGDYVSALSEYREALKYAEKTDKVTRSAVTELKNKIAETTQRVNDHYGNLAQEHFLKAQGLMQQKKYYEARDAFDYAKDCASKAGNNDMVKDINSIMAGEPFPTMKQIDDYEKTELAKIEKYEDDALEPYEKLEDARDRVYNAYNNYLWYKSMGYDQDDFIVRNAKEDCEEAEFDLARAIGQVNDPQLDHAYDQMRAAYSHYSLMMWLHGEENSFTEMAYQTYLLEKERFNGKISAVAAVEKHKVGEEVKKRKAALEAELANRRANLPDPPSTEATEIKRVDEDEF